jgi:hypothetical protein
MTRARVWLGRALAIAAPVIGLGLFADSISAQQPGSSEFTFVVNTRGFESRLLRNCDLFFVNGSGTQNFIASEDGPARGAFNLAQRSGEVYSKAHAWEVELFRLPGGRRIQPSTSFTDLGIALQKKSVFLTGRIVRGPVLIAASRRVKLAVVRGAKIEEASLLDARKHAVPNTFAFFTSGKLTMLPAMSRALEGQRCKDPHVTTSSPIHPGYTMGRFVARVLPGTARGLAGEAAMFVFAGPTDTVSPPVTVEASGGSTLTSEGHLAAPLATGAGVPLTCIDGQDCAPSTGVSIAGGFDLVSGGRRASVGSLAVALAGDQETITGTIDGAPVTVAVGGVGAEPEFTSEFDQAAGAALGESIDGGMKIGTNFTTLGPAG